MSGFHIEVDSDIRVVVRFFSRRSFLREPINSSTFCNFAVTKISLFLEPRMIPPSSGGWPVPAPCIWGDSMTAQNCDLGEELR